MISAVAAALGYGVVAALPVTVTAFVQAFAGGALMTMLGDTMIPEGYEAAGRWAGIVLVLGFALSLGLTALEALA